MKYAVTDIETTGGSHSKNKITEIAIFVFDGSTIIDEFISLVNPECSIPYHIIQLTGISNQMVANAPKFYEIASKIVEITRDCTFVAHNSGFDYNFIKAEFSSLGYNFERNVLCTLQTSRKHLPGHKSYSLGNLCNDLGIKLTGRHRAAGDALATVELLKLLQVRAPGVFGINGGKNPLHQLYKLPAHINPNIDLVNIDKVPELVGVYYLFDEVGEVIYVGKSLHLRSRIFEHLRNNSTKKAIEMASKITNVGFELTGNEMLALILEWHEIQNLKPHYNRLGRIDASTWSIISQMDNKGYIRLKVTSKPGDIEPLAQFEKKDQATDFLDRTIFEYNLCQTLCGRSTGKGACFHSMINQCNGACTGKESPDDYNQRVEKFINSESFSENNFFIQSPGRSDDEWGITKIAGGKYCGFGYVDKNCPDLNEQMLHDCIVSYPESRKIRTIIRSFLQNSNEHKVFVFKQ